MAAGLGFKDFTTGEVLTAADVDGYLMQGIWVFASEAARNAAVTSPQEGNFAFTKDNNSLWYYDGAAWVASGATGDIEGVTAGVGISGGGTSGTVTITNSMATAIDAKGDLVVGTGADTFSRLAVGGTNGHVLTVDSAEATGMKWAAAGGGASFVGCNLYKTGNQTISHDTITAITWDAESFDTDGFHSTTTDTSRITIPNGKGGKYYFGGLVSAESGTNGRALFTRVNNANQQQVYYEQVTQNSNVYFSWNLIRNLSAGDYCEVLYDQQSGANKNFYGGSANDSSFYCVYLGA